MANPLDQIPKEHVVMLKGRPHPTYPGVLAAAYANGLVGLEAKIEQIPCEQNGWMAVCSAVATFRGEDGRDRVYAEVGDADPGNCTPHIVPHKIRMAATRAKGRALRDALGIGVALKEEIDGTDTDAVHDVGNRQTRGIQPNENVKPPANTQHRAHIKQNPPNPAPVSAPVPVVEPEAGEDPEVLTCEVCGELLTYKAIVACRDHPELFDGKWLCAAHRKDYRDQREVMSRATVPSGILA
jgi:hypothetical protein